MEWTSESWNEQASGRLRALRKILPVLVGKSSCEETVFDKLVCQFAEVVDQWVARNSTGEEGASRLLRWMATSDYDRNRQLRARRALGGPKMLTVNCRDQSEAQEVMASCSVILADGGRFLPSAMISFRNEEMGLSQLPENAFVVVVMVQDPPPVMMRELIDTIGIPRMGSRRVSSDDLPGKYYGQALDRFDYETKHD